MKNYIKLYQKCLKIWPKLRLFFNFFQGLEGDNSGGQENIEGNIDAIHRDFDNLITKFEVISRDTGDFTASNYSQRKRIVIMTIVNCIWTLFTSNNIKTIFFELFKTIGGGIKVLPRYPFPGPDGSAVNFKVGRSDGGTAEIDFLSTQSVG